MLVDLSLKDFYQVLASDSPAPGGGSVAALSGAMGAGLVSMVCRLTVGKKGYESSEEIAKETMAKSDALGDELLSSVDKDTEAFNGVMAAFKMPKDSDEEKAARTSAIQKGYKEAVQSPLSIAQNCLEVMELAHGMMDRGNSNALSDIGVGADMAFSGLEGAIMNVEINLPSIKDGEFVKDMENKVAVMEARGKELRDKIHSFVKNKLKS